MSNHENSAEAQLGGESLQRHRAQKPDIMGPHRGKYTYVSKKDSPIFEKVRDTRGRQENNRCKARNNKNKDTSSNKKIYHDLKEHVYKIKIITLG